MASSRLIFVVLLAAFGFASCFGLPVTTSTSTSRVAPQNLYNQWYQYYPGNNIGWGYPSGLGYNSLGWGYPGAAGYNSLGWGYPAGAGYTYGYGLNPSYSKRTVTTRLPQYSYYYGMPRVSTSQTTQTGAVIPQMPAVTTNTVTNHGPYGFPTGYLGGLYGGYPGTN